MTAAIPISTNLTLEVKDSSTENTPYVMDDLSPFGYAVCAVLLFLIMIVGFFNNLTVIIVVSTTKKLRTPMNAILLNLSISDFIISVVGTPLSFTSAVNGGWAFSDEICQAYAFMMTLSGMTAIGTIAAIAFERYIIISRSLQGHNLTPETATTLIILIYVYSLAQSLPPLLGWNRYIVEHPGIACSLDWQTSSSSNTSFIIYIFVLGYVIPVFTMSFCYLRVVWILKMSPKPNSRSSTAKAEQRVTKMAFTMILCIITAWTPYSIVSLMVSLGYEHLLGPVSSVSPAIFAKTSVIYNPIVYFFFNTQIREAILTRMPKNLQRGRISLSDISLETKRGVSIVHTTISNQVVGNHNGNVMTSKL